MWNCHPELDSGSTSLVFFKPSIIQSDSEESLMLSILLRISCRRDFFRWPKWQYNMKILSNKNKKLIYQFYQCPESPTKSTRMIAINDLINSPKSSFSIPLLRVFIRWYVQKISLWMERRVNKTMYCNKVIVSGYSIERILHWQW